MEYIVFFVSIGLFCVFLIGREYTLSKRRDKELRRALYEDYGKAPERKYSAERYERIGSYYKKHGKRGQVDDVTWNDLNMDEVFKRMDFTCSAAGEEYLYYTLRNTAKSGEELSHLEKLIRFFDSHPDERVEMQILLHKLGHTGKYSLYDYLDHLDDLGERSSGKSILCDLLALAFVLLLPLRIDVAVMGIALVFAVNIITYYREKGETEPYVISFLYVVRLLQCCEELQKLPLAECGEELSLIREHGKRMEAMRRGSFWVFREYQGASGNPLDVVFDYLRILLHIDLIQFNRMLKFLRGHMQDVDVLIGQVGLLDTAAAVAAFRKSLPEGYCVPVFSDGKGFAADGMYHPLLKAPVKNGIRAERGVLLTGSNASGKSTFLKTAALNAILAQTIHTCTAERYEGCLFQIVSSMALRDDIESGESYYIVEIKAVKRILQAKEEGERPVLCFVDEVLRGTNTVERIAAATQILKSLTGERILCFAATHDIELTELLGGCYDNYHFEEQIQEGDILFPYQLLPGRAASRNAIRLLEIMGYDPGIVEAAKEQAERFLQTGRWS